jgi:uncharacterized membrane protein
MTTGTERPPHPDAAQSSTPAVRRTGTRIGWTWIALSSLAIAVYAVVPYFTASLTELADSGASGLAGTYAPLPMAVQAAFYAHIVAGGVAIIAGPFQFWRGLRDRHRSVHRAIGRTYLTAVAVAGVAALVMVPFNDAGLVGFFGFGSMAVLWLVTAWRAYRAIRLGDVSNHRAWMMRNFALTYSAVTLRLWIGVLVGVQLIPGGDVDFGAVFENAYAAVPFLAWLPNLVVAEWLIRRRGLPSYRLSSGTGIANRAETSSRVRG